MNNLAENKGIWVRQPWEPEFEKYVDLNTTIAGPTEAKGRERFGIPELIKKAGYCATIFGLIASLGCGSVTIPELVNETTVASTREALPHGGPIVIYPDSSFV